MPRDKKIIHRATSDVEDDDDNINEEEDQENVKQEELDNQITGTEEEDTNDLLEERKKYLKDIILKRTSALKQQRERSKHQRIGSTRN